MKKLNKNLSRKQTVESVVSMGCSCWCGGCGVDPVGNNAQAFGVQNYSIQQAAYAYAMAMGMCP